MGSGLDIRHYWLRGSAQSVHSWARRSVWWCRVGVVVWAPGSECVRGCLVERYGPLRYGRSASGHSGALGIGDRVAVCIGRSCSIGLAGSASARRGSSWGSGASRVVSVSVDFGHLGALPPLGPPLLVPCSWRAGWVRCSGRRAHPGSGTSRCLSGRRLRAVRCDRESRAGRALWLIVGLTADLGAQCAT